MLTIYNSLTKQKDIFVPMKAHEVSMYVCGITVYDYCHIGHARSNSIFDTVVRYLRFIGYKVRYVRNITDVDDKIIRRANDNQEGYELLTTRFIEAMHEDFAKLNILRPDAEPLATEYIQEMIALIETLIEKSHAYVGRHGDVYFRVNSFKNYGQLSHKTLEDLQSGIRIALTEEKENPLDFVLWKSAKPEEPAWESPWGLGRPGWHIECSAMSMKLLGHTFDIHGGGNDLKFPHHENEVAQSEAVTNETFARYWLHNGMVTVDKEKMSKSLGNFFTVREVLETIKPEVLRYFLVASHYRSPINYSIDSLTMAEQAMDRFYTALRGLVLQDNIVIDNAYHARFIAAMDDDFNTPLALSVLFEMTHAINTLRHTDIEEAALLASQLKHLANILGILYLTPESYFSSMIKHTPEMCAKIESLIALRAQARADKDWALADKVRDELQALEILIEDTPQGTIWRSSR
jgi:cysteinyl-tRNA synthetase